MKVTESYSYRQDTAAVCRDTNTGLSCLVVSDFPSSNHGNFLFDQTKERKKCFRFITQTYFIFADLCI